MHIEPEVFSFVDCEGKYRRIRPSSCRAVFELKDALGHLYRWVGQTKIKSFTDMMLYDFEFRAIAEHCLELCHLSLDELDPQTAELLLLPSEDYAFGILGEVNGLRPAESTDSEPGKGGSLDDMVGAIWTQTQDLAKALDIAGVDKEDLSPERLGKIAEEHAKLSDPAYTEGQRKKEDIELALKNQAEMKAKSKPKSDFVPSTKNILAAVRG